MSLFKDCGHQFVEMGTAPEQFTNLIDRAIRVAKATHARPASSSPPTFRELEYEPPSHTCHRLGGNDVDGPVPAGRRRGDDRQTSGDPAGRAAAGCG